MTIRFNPSPGDVLICDFSAGFKAPEMVKRRPVVIIAPRHRYGPGLVTVTPLSTTPPRPDQIWTAKLYLPLPPPYGSPVCWVKGDMLYTVSFDRLMPFRIGKNEDGKRIYQPVSLTPEQFATVQRCVLNGLGFFDLAKQIETIGLG